MRNLRSAIRPFIVFCFLFLFVGTSFGAIMLYDEGTLLGPTNRINCSGTGLTCTHSGITGTFTVSASAETDPLAIHKDGSVVWTASQSLGDFNFTNVGNIALDSISPDGDTVLINMTESAEYMQINQTNAVGIEDQPLIFINDDRTGTTANETSEATVVWDTEGTYLWNIVDGQIYIGTTSSLSTGSVITSRDNIGYAFGSSDDIKLFLTTNGTGDDFFALQLRTGGAPYNTNSSLFWLANYLYPSNMTDHNGYVAPTIVLPNQQGADAGDYAGVVIGERTQADVAAAHYFDLYAMTGAADGSVNATTTELAAIFRIGASGSSTPGNATTPGDVLFEGSIEVDGTTHTQGGLVIPSGTTPAPNIVGAIYLDTDESANGSLMVYGNAAWRKVADLP